jgi:hypothetical protein
VGFPETLDAGATTSSLLRPHLRSYIPDVKTFGTRLIGSKFPFFYWSGAVYFC